MFTENLLWFMTLKGFVTRYLPFLEQKLFISNASQKTKVLTNKRVKEK